MDRIFGINRKEMKISEHISYEEATASSTAIRLEIDNTPTEEQIENMKLLADKVIEPTREFISRKRGKDSPIKITSFFRCEKLNEAIGGSKTSQHCKGEAADLQVNFEDFSKKDLFWAIKERATFDQLIVEFKDGNMPAWIHISYSKTYNRRQVLIATHKDGKAMYLPFSSELFSEIYG